MTEKASRSKGKMFVGAECSTQNSMIVIMSQYHQLNDMMDGIEKDKDEQN